MALKRIMPSAQVDGTDITAAMLGVTGSSKTGGTAKSRLTTPNINGYAIEFEGTVTSGSLYFYDDISTDVIAFDKYFLIDTSLSGSQALVALYSGGTRGLSFEMTSTRTITIKDSAYVTQFTSAALPLASTICRLVGYATRSAAAASIQIKIYTGADLASLTQLSDSTLLTGKATGASAWTQIRNGLKGGTGTQTGKIRDLTWAYDPAATGLLAAYDPNTAPTASAGPDQTKLPGTVCTLDGTGSSDPEGNTLTYAWTPPGGITLSSNTSSSPTFTTPFSLTEQTYSFGLVVTDTGALSSSSDTVVITVPAHPEWYLNGAGVWKAETHIGL